MNSKFWKGKKVLLTGHTGFKGSWLSIWLKKLDVELIGFAKDIPTRPSLFELANVKDGISSLKGDIRDFKKLDKIVKDRKPDIIIHLAAQAIVQKSYDNPLETYSTNVMGTANILESAKKTDSVKVILIVTSDKCYENRNLSRGYREVDPMGGYDPYSNSKGCAELVISSFRNSFFNPQKFNDHKVAIASVRSGNVIGGGDWSSYRLFPDIIRAVLKNEPVTIRNPYGIRPWQHVLEPLNGYLLLAEKLWKNGKQYSESWNFGPNYSDNKPVSWILKEINKHWTRKLKWIIENKNSFYEANQLKLDCSKAKLRLGWKPKTDLKIAIEWTIDWYEQYMRRKDLRSFTEQQIEVFNKLKV